MNIDRQRVISITLSEAEWKAFIQQQPDPVAWLRARILEVAGPVVEEPMRELAIA